MQDKNGKAAGRPRKYDTAFKRMVISEYRSGRWTMEQLRRRYALAGKSCIAEWMAQIDLAPGQAPGSEVWATNPTPLPTRKKKDRSEDLRKRIKELERQLEDEQIKSEAYSKLIDLAESEHRIAIRKKANTK
jgi:transposase-like protein